MHSTVTKNVPLIAPPQQGKVQLYMRMYVIIVYHFLLLSCLDYKYGHVGLFDLSNKL